MGRISFPGGGLSGSSTSSSKSKKPCKYGPRDSDGYCPKAPKKAKSAKKKAPCKYGPRDEDGYCPKKPSSYSGSSSTSTKKKPATAAQKKRDKQINTLAREGGKLVGDATGIVVKGVIRNRKDIITIGKNISKLPVKQVATAAASGSYIAGGLLTAVALAGIGAYFLTSYIINRGPKSRAEMNEAAAQAAAAYKASRDEATKKQGGKPLTVAQLKVLSDTFKAELARIGVVWPLRSN